MTFNCEKCGLFLGEMEKGKIRNGAVLLCSHCWGQADIAMQMAELAKSQADDFFKDKKGKDSEVVDHLMGMFGMKK